MWIFHGPARCIERKNAFIMRSSYKKYLIEGVLGLPPNWHTLHHSGDTIGTPHHTYIHTYNLDEHQFGGAIDRISKGTEKLFEYAGML
jgi:ATP-binding cassette subfamily B protein